MFWGIFNLLILLILAVSSNWGRAHSDRAKKEINRSPPSLARPTIEPTGPLASVYKKILKPDK